MGRGPDAAVVAFGRRLRVLRESQGLSQERLAHDAGMDRTYVSGIERGVRNPSLRNIAKLAEALGVKIGALFDSR
jgi:transcriptional regulator with XRE-family HTH domain